MEVKDKLTTLESLKVAYDANRESINTLSEELLAQMGDVAQQSDVDALNARVTNLELNAGGDSNAEVVDARVSNSGTTYGTLKERLDEEYNQLTKELENDFSQLSEEIANKTGTGLSTEAIDKLEEVGNYLAYTTADGGAKWTELISILRNGSSGGGSGETVPATGISLDKTILSFTDSTSQTLVATVEPSDTTDKVVWTSNAESVATVTNGVVKPLSNGSAIITATCGSVSATCSVTVDIAEEEQVTLTSISATYTGGDVAVGTALTDLTGITVTGTYSDGSIANVTGYTLSGDILVGENTITVSYGGKTTTFTVTGVAEETDPLYGTYWPPAPMYANINSNEYYTYTGNSGEYIDAGLPSANAVRLNDKLEGTVYIRTLTSNQYGTLPNTYTLYANDDGEIATGGFSEVKPTITRSLGTMVVNDKTYYFVLFKFEIPSGKKGLFVSAMNSMQREYFISTDKNNIDEEYKQYYTLFTSDPTDRITEPATEVN